MKIKLKIQIVEDGIVVESGERDLPDPMYQELILISAVLTHNQGTPYYKVDCIFGLLSAGVDTWLQDYAKHQLKIIRGSFGID